MQSFIDIGKVRAALNLNPYFTSFGKIILECWTENRQITSVSISFVDTEVKLSDSLTQHGSKVTEDGITHHFIDVVNAAFTAGANKVKVTVFASSSDEGVGKLSFSEEYSF